MIARFTEYWSTTETIFDPTVQRPICQLVIMLPGAGCEWAKKSGGCYMCGFSCATRKYSRGLLLPAAVFKVMIKKALSKNQGIGSVAIYNGGSFLNPREIPESVPIWLCKQIEISKHVRQLFVESRPEFVDDVQIRTMVDSLGSKVLKVGIGLECATDFIRERCVHKGFSLQEYSKAVQTLKSLGARILTYIFLKPLFLSEAEAIEEAVKTIVYAFEQGSDEVALESAFVQKGTFMHRMFQSGKFKPPWLWSIIEVVRRTYHLGFVHVGGFTDEPPPVATPANCTKCSKLVKESLQKFREVHDIGVLDGLRCDCQAEWLSELSREYVSLEERTGSKPTTGARL